MYQPLDEVKTKKILQRVSEKPGVGWYGIVKYIDSRGASPEPSTYAVLQDLAENSFLRKDPPDGGDDAKFYLSDSGQELLEKLLTSEGL